MSTVATARPDELELLAKLDQPNARAIMGQHQGLAGCQRKGWVDATRQGHPDWANSPHPVTIEAYEISPRGRCIIADARALGWKSKQPNLF